ncbi:hypothetical protein [Dyadobacter sp. 32]|uniref:hypothetical protein n=1 Tax=Dyadobacter sp. 32 TaxID=538966 RepID=UPI0039C5EA10
MEKSLPTIESDLVSFPISYALPMKHFLLSLLLILPLLNGCQECGPQKELTVDVSISGTPNRLKKITALGVLNDEKLKEQSDSTLKDYWMLKLPISLNSDQTTYIFEFENRTDTMAIFYVRDFYYEDGCGFVADVKSARGLSTFSNLSVSATSYIGKGEFLNPYHGGIRIHAYL